MQLTRLSANPYACTRDSRVWIFVQVFFVHDGVFALLCLTHLELLSGSNTSFSFSIPSWLSFSVPALATGHKVREAVGAFLLCLEPRVAVSSEVPLPFFWLQGTEVISHRCGKEHGGARRLGVQRLAGMSEPSAGSP